MQLHVVALLLDHVLTVFVVWRPRYKMLLATRLTHLIYVTQLLLPGPGTVHTCMDSSLSVGMDS